MKKIIIAFFLFQLIVYGTSESKKLELAKQLIDQKGIDFMMENVVKLTQKEYPKKMDTIDTVTRVYYIKSSNTRVMEHTPKMEKNYEGKYKANNQAN